MKRIVGLFLTIIMVWGIFINVPVTVVAASVDDLTFTLNSDGKSYTLTKADEYTTGSLTIPSKYNKLPVTAIASNAFRECDTIISVKIPDTVKTIGDTAFFGCTYLESVDMGDGVTNIGRETFGSCTSLSSVVWSKKLKSIGEYAFNNCKSFTSVSLPNGVETIGERAFQNCDLLQKISFPNSVRSIGYAVISSTPYSNNTENWDNGSLYVSKHFISGKSIREGTITIADSAMSSVYDVDEIVIPDSVKAIGKAAFNSGDFKKITIGKSVETIGESAFSGCEYITKITIPSSVKTIGHKAFYECKNLVSCKIADGLESVGSYAFWRCENLNKFNLPDTVNRIGVSAFMDTPIVDNVKNWDDKLLYVGNHLIEVRDTMSGNLNIKKGTITIADEAAGWCESLKSITIPDTVTSIGDSAFKSCKAVESIKIGKNVKRIGVYSFSHCVSLKSITIPSSVVTIEDMAFYTCSGVMSIKIPSSVKTIGEKAFGYKYSYGDEKIKDFSIFGKKNTEAEKYAKNNGFTFVENPKLKSVENCYEGVKITWTKSTGADGYLVYRKTSSTKYQKIAKITKNSTISYVDKTVKNGGQYTYMLKAYKGNETSEKSNELSIKVLFAPKLAKISNVAKGVKITWNKVTGAEKYYVYRKTSGGSYSKLATTKNTYYTDKTAKSGKKYYYIVKAVKSSTISASSSAKSILHLADTTLKTPSSTKSGVKLTWTKVTGAEGYMVYRKTGSGSYSKLATVKGSTKVTYTDKSAKKGKKYTYKVKAYKSKTYSAYSNRKSITDKY